MACINMLSTPDSRFRCVTTQVWLAAQFALTARGECDGPTSKPSVRLRSLPGDCLRGSWGFHLRVFSQWSSLFSQTFPTMHLKELQHLITQTLFSKAIQKVMETSRVTHLLCCISVGHRSVPGFTLAARHECESSHGTPMGYVPASASDGQQDSSLLQVS